MSVENAFSVKAKEIIGWSRDIAIELGYDYISTIHVLLADCKTDCIHSIKDFIFKDDFEFNNFYENQRIGPTSLLHESLPLTLEAENMIRLSVRLWHRTYMDDEVQTYHLFLAAANLKNTSFRSIFRKQDNLINDLEKYYVSIGAIKAENIHKSFFQKIFQKHR